MEENTEKRVDLTDSSSLQAASIIMPTADIKTYFFIFS